MMFNEPYPKYIVEFDDEDGENHIVIGKCFYHIELAIEEDNVRGGGWYDMDYENKTITFHGTSDRFGSPEFEDIKNIVSKGLVNSKYGLRDYTEFSFKYNIGSEIIDL